jgi:hypothetical protein
METTAIKTQWNKLADFYTKFYAPNFFYCHAPLLNMGDVLSGDSILELSCGDGSMTTYLAL